jgi:uncharacterized protein YeeX (DUF496 family)
VKKDTVENALEEVTKKIDGFKRRLDTLLDNINRYVKGQIEDRDVEQDITSVVEQIRGEVNDL